MKHISKLMSLALRHQPDVLNLTLDGQGWANVEELLKGLKSKGLDLEMNDLIHVVETNDKQRFKFNSDRSKIVANQGHSIRVNLQLEPTIPPVILYHGTVEKFMESIREKGLIKGSRHHVHLSAALETAKAVGARRGKPVVLQVDTTKMVKDGFVFYCADNGVWLTDTVPPNYLI